MSIRILIAFASLSGNTREVARVVRAGCERAGYPVTWVETDIQTLRQAAPHPHHDLYLLGSWSDNAGRTPPEMKRFIADLVDAVGGKPAHVAAFGTGETQWGEEYFCGAVHRIARFFDSPYPPLAIEQMPHGERDARAIAAWTERVLALRVGATAGTDAADPAGAPSQPRAEAGTFIDPHNERRKRQDADHHRHFA